MAEMSIPAKLRIDPSKPAWLTNFYSGYRNSARQYKREWALTVEEFECLVVSVCSYCDAPPARRSWKTGRSAQPRFFEATGIDRVDSSIGYVASNCVPCCELCNRMKMALNADEFLAHVRRIAAYT